MDNKDLLNKLKAFFSNENETEATTEKALFVDAVLVDGTRIQVDTQVEGELSVGDVVYILDEEGYEVWNEPGTPGDIPPASLYADCDMYVPDPGEVCDSAVTAVIGTNYNPGAPYWFTYTATIDGIIMILAKITPNVEERKK